MAPGKHSRKNRKRKRSQSQSQSRHVSPEHLFEQVWQSLAKGDGRGALDQLRQAQHEDGKSEGLPLLFFCACIQRARQLAGNGLDREAAAMRTRAAQHRASISPRTLREEDLARYVGYLDGADALAVYADYLNARPPVLQAERSLADLLVIRRCWEGVEILDADHPLRRDAGQVMRSLDAMDAGDWERVAELLRGVPRRSPFAAWRVFCKAMVCFGAGDDQGLRRTLDLLPADFALAHTVAEWRRLCTGEGEGGAVQVQRALGTVGTAVEVLGEELRQALRGKDRPRVVERSIVSLADVLGPDDPCPARMDLLQIAGLATQRHQFSMQTVRGLMRRLLPAERVAGALARIELLLQRLAPDTWDPAPAAAYLKRLPVEFPRAADRALARGRVLEALARTGHQAVQHPEHLPPRMVKTLSALLDGRIDEPEMLFVELMVASLDADPGNREGYRFLLDLLRGHRDNKPRLRSILEEMATRFPEDPDPWLELTALHYSRNAYRRAEHALAEARLRAPHDERILDLQAIGFLKSADQSRKSGRFALAARDLQRAEELGRPKLGTLLQAKQLLLAVVSAGGDAAGVVAPHLENLPPDAQIRTLALLIHDLSENSHVKNVSPEMESTVKGLLARKAPAIDDLGPDEMVDLLAPLPGDLRILFSGLHIAPVLADWWADIMRRLDGDRLLAVFDVLMDCGRRAAVRAEINRRLRGVKKYRRDPLLLLYLAVVRYQERQDRDARRFMEALDLTSASDLERLRVASMRLARHARGILREALQKFDFALLDMPVSFFGHGAPFSIEDVLNDVIDPPPPPPPPPSTSTPELVNKILVDEFLEALRRSTAGASPEPPPQGSLFGDGGAARELGMLEDLIDRHGLLGIPSFALEDMAAFAREEPHNRRTLDRLARKCEAAGLRSVLSREAQILLFPGAGKK